MSYTNEELKKEEDGFFGKCWANVERHQLLTCKRRCVHKDCPYYGNNYYARKIPVTQLICAILTGIYAIVFIAIFLSKFADFINKKRGLSWGDILGEFIMPLMLISIVILLISDIRRIIDKKVDRDFELKERAKEKE
jgi:uncharacterized membrane protein